MNYKLGSLFDGSGGFPLAGFLTGVEACWASEVEPYPIAVTKTRFPMMKHLGDISKINGAEIEPVDIITFGSPCQDLSVAGKRAGLKHETNGDDETTRSGLFMEAVRIIKEMREKTNGKYPRFALWENVPGAFSSNKGEDFRIVLEELIKIAEPTAVMPAVPKKGWAYSDSYVGDGWSLAYRVFDAQYWGVPQRRRRIHLVADFGGQCAREVLFEREGVRGYFTEGGTTWEGIAYDAQGSAGATDSKGAIPYTLKIRSGCEGGGKGSLIQTNKSATLSCNNDQYVFQPVCFGISAYNSNSMKSDNPHSGIYEAETSRTIDTSGGNPTCNQGGIAIVEPIAVATQQGGAEVSENGVCPTITAAAGMSGNNQPWICHDAGGSVGVDIYNTSLTWDKACSLTAQGYGSTGTCPKVIQFVLDDQGGSQISVRKDGKCPTLRAEMHGNIPCVLYDARGNGDGKTASTVTGDHENRITDYTNVVCQPVLTSSKASFFTLTEEDLASTLVATDYKDPQLVCYSLDGDKMGKAEREGGSGFGVREDNKMYTLTAKDVHGVVYAVDQGGGKSAANVSEDLSPTLTCTHGGEPAVTYEKPIALDRAFFNQGKNALYEPQIYEDGTVSTIIAKGPSAVCYRYIVRRLTPTECARLQGFADRWGDIDTKTDFTDEEYKFWLDVRNTHAAINGKATKDYTKQQMLNWYGKLATDSAEYKMWGNGIALPPALYCIQGIVDALNGVKEN